MRANIFELLTPARQAELKHQADKQRIAKRGKLIERRSKADKPQVDAAVKSAIQVAAEKLTGTGLINLKTITASAQAFKKLCGVYFLICKGEIVYIGQSIDIMSRIGQHFGVYEFDAWYCIECDRESLNVIESLYIHAYLPVLNGQNHLGTAISPLSVNTLIQMAEEA